MNQKFLFIGIGYGGYGGEPFSCSCRGIPITMDLEHVLNLVAEEHPSIRSHIEELLVIQNDEVVRHFGFKELDEQHHQDLLIE